MATDTKAAPPSVTPYRLTARQFVTMIDAGVFPKGPRVELLGGRLFLKMTKNDPHDFTVGKLGDLTRPILPADWFIREEKSFRLGRYWRPESDFTLVRGRREDYPARAPRAADLALVVEVSDTTYAKDIGIMLRRYAASKVAFYWIINLTRRQVEVDSNPTGRGNSARYRDVAIFGRDAEVSVVVEGREVVWIALRDLIP